MAAQDAEAGGRAHAGTAVVEEAGGAWFNPAALADGGGFRATVGATLAQATVRADDLEGGWQATSDTPLGTPPYLGLAYAQADWALSAWAGVPFGGGVRWEDDFEGRFEALQSDPRFFRAQLAFAYRIGPVRLAAAVHVDTGQLEIARATDHVGAEGRIRARLRGTGVGGDGYVLVTPGDHASVGLSYKSRTTLPLQGEADFEVPVPFQATLPDQAVSSRLVLPDRIGLGFAWRDDDWRLAADAVLTLWSTNDELVLDFVHDDTPDTTLENGWRPSVALRVGAEGRVHPLLRVRGGLEVDGLSGAPPPPELLSPSSPDSTRIGPTLGLSVDPHEVVQLHGWAQVLALLPRESESRFEARYRGVAVLGGLGLTVAVPRQGAGSEASGRSGSSESTSER